MQVSHYLDARNEITEIGDRVVFNHSGILSVGEVERIFRRDAESVNGYRRYRYTITVRRTDGGKSKIKNPLATLKIGNGLYG